MDPHSQSHATGLRLLAGGLWQSRLGLAVALAVLGYVAFCFTLIALCGDASLGSASIDETLGAASQSSVDRLAAKVDGLAARLYFLLVISTTTSIGLSGFTLWKLNNLYKNGMEILQIQ